MKKIRIKLSRGQTRLAFLIVGGVIGVVILGILPNYFINEYEITDFASIATIVAASFTLMGTIFTTIYKEISSYYKDKSESAQKRWDLVFPMITSNYMPWISSAHSLADSFQNVIDGDLTLPKLNRICFLMALFYGIRLRNLQKNGGYILLSSIEDEEEVNDAYSKIKEKLNWAGVDTPNLANKLAEVFVKFESEKNPYSLSQFELDLEKDKTVQKCMEKLTSWLDSDRETKAKDAKVVLEDFEKKFKKNINKLSSTWDK